MDEKWNLEVVFLWKWKMLPSVAYFTKCWNSGNLKGGLRVGDLFIFPFQMVSGKISQHSCSCVSIKCSWRYREKNMEIQKYEKKKDIQTIYKLNLGKIFTGFLLVKLGQRTQLLGKLWEPPSNSLTSWPAVHRHPHSHQQDWALGYVCIYHSFDSNFFNVSI